MAAEAGAGPGSSARIEVVRFDVPPERAVDLVAGHEPARVRMEALGPGCLWSRLARFDERSWVEIVAWRELAAFERVFERATKTPEVKEWFDLAEPGFTLEVGEPIEGDAAAPPAAGFLELIESRGGREGDLVAAPSELAAWSALIELGEHSWKDDVRIQPPRRMLRLNAFGADGELAQGWGRVAEIVHSFDAAGEQAPAA